MIRDRLPVNPCARQGCPVLGHWAPGDYCPTHDTDPCQHGTTTCPWCRPDDDTTAQEGDKQ